MQLRKSETEEKSGFFLRLEMGGLSLADVLRVPARGDRRHQRWDGVIAAITMTTIRHWLK